MCDKIETLRFEHIDSRHAKPDAVRPIIDAAFKAQDESCCALRWNAIHRAAYAKATELGFGIATGDTIKRLDNDPDAVHFYVWPANTIHKHTVARILEENNAHKMTGRSYA